MSPSHLGITRILQALGQRGLVAPMVTRPVNSHDTRSDTHSSRLPRLISRHTRTYARTHAQEYARTRTHTHISDLFLSRHKSTHEQIRRGGIPACIKVGRWGEACTISPKSDMCTALQITCERAPVREKHMQPARTHPSQLPNKRPA